MPISSIHSHPLPVNPTTGQHPLTSLGGARASSGSMPPITATTGGGVSRETLNGLQDVEWSDDEEEPDCGVCAEPLDLSDQNFKPCQCGFSVCQFCYNRLLNSESSRCPGCRRPYDAKKVVFQPVDWEEVKRMKEKKARRAKTIKQLTNMGRRNLLDVRVVVKNTVYVIGMKLPAPGDESISILRSNDYFGQYGKIARIYLRDRSSVPSSSSLPHNPDDPSTYSGIYIAYVRREDAARAITALNGIAAPQGPPGRTLSATYATCRYCDNFLKGQKCDNPGCRDLHEWSGDGDSFTKEDMQIALTRPNEYEARQREARLRGTSLSKSISKPSALDEALGNTSALPNSAGWGKGIVSRQPSIKAAAPIGTSRPAKPAAPATISLTNNAAFPLPTPSPAPPQIHIKEKKNKASSSAMARGRSNDSAQSGSGNTSSAHASPKKRPVPLATTIVTNKVTPVPIPPAPVAASSVTSPPGLTRAKTKATSKVTAVVDGSNGDAANQLPEDLQDESVSADSEAGPSSSSPAPTTPLAQADVPPPPLTADPITVHSPYEEPRIFSFPSADPDFEYVLCPDEAIQRQAQESKYAPSPFSRTLLGLAKLGILTPEVLEPLNFSPEPEAYGVSGLFSPFDASTEVIPDSLPGPSRQRGEDITVEERRTTSRFDFARPSSRPTISREQSPFNLRRSIDEGDMWGKSNFSGVMPMQGGQVESGRHAHGIESGLQMNGTGNSSGMGSTGYGGDAWPQTRSGYHGQQQQQQQGYHDGPGSGMEPRRQGSIRSRGDQDDYGMGGMPTPSRPQSKYMDGGSYGPNGGTADHEGLYSGAAQQHGGSMHHPHSGHPQHHGHQQPPPQQQQQQQPPHHFHQPQQQQQQNHPHFSSQSPVNGYGAQDARIMAQYNQQRARSPTPMGHGYRRL